MGRRNRVCLSSFSFLRGESLTAKTVFNILISPPHFYSPPPVTHRKTNTVCRGCEQVYRLPNSRAEIQYLHEFHTQHIMHSHLTFVNNRVNRWASKLPDVFSFSVWVKMEKERERIPLNSFFICSHNVSHLNQHSEEFLEDTKAVTPWTLGRLWKIFKVLTFLIKAFICSLIVQRL